MAERPRVGLLVPNLFTRVPIDGLVRQAGADPVALAGAAAAIDAGFAAVIIDLDALGADAAPLVARLTEAGSAVLAFGPHVDAERLAAARRAGAVVLPRGAFLQRLPELLATALRVPS